MPVTEPGADNPPKPVPAEHATPGPAGAPAPASPLASPLTSPLAPTRPPLLAPLLAATKPSTVVAWRAQGPVVAATMLADIEALAARLPEQGPMLNLCGDRYHFAVAFCAAALRGHTSLLPPNQTATMLAPLREQWPGLYALVDGETGRPADLPAVVYDTRGARPRVGTAFRVPDLPADHLAALVFTSGSTGRPSAHPKHWASLITNVRAEARRLGLDDGRPATLVGTVPSQHMYGFESAVLLALHNGIALHAGKPFFAADIVATLAGIDGDRVLVTTPYHLRNLLESGVEVPPLRLVLSATAPLDPALAREAEARLKAPLLEIYGCTEAGQLATRRTIVDPTWQTFDGVRIDRHDDGWYASGGHIAEPTRLADRLELDGPERFRLLGRDNDLVNIAGKRTSIGHLNHLIQSIPGVRDGAFVDPDDDTPVVADTAAAGGATAASSAAANGAAAGTRRRSATPASPRPAGPRRLIAFFVSDTLDARAVLAALRSMTDPAFLPRPLYRVDALPRAETGKLPRQALLALAERCRSR